MVAALLARLVRPVVRRGVVEGHSMIPAYVPGERIWLLRRLRPLRVGDVVAFSLPDAIDLMAIKRVAALSGRFATLLGDNADASRDSREFGPVSIREIHWFVWPQRGA